MARPNASKVYNKLGLTTDIYSTHLSRVKVIETPVYVYRRGFRRRFRWLPLISGTMFYQTYNFSLVEEAISGFNSILLKDSKNFNFRFIQPEDNKHEIDYFKVLGERGSNYFEFIKIDLETALDEIIFVASHIKSQMIVNNVGLESYPPQVVFLNLTHLSPESDFFTDFEKAKKMISAIAYSVESGIHVYPVFKKNGCPKWFEEFFKIKFFSMDNKPTSENYDIETEVHGLEYKTKIGYVLSKKTLFNLHTLETEREYVALMKEKNYRSILDGIEKIKILKRLEPLDGREDLFNERE